MFWSSPQSPVGESNPRLRIESPAVLPLTQRAVFHLTPANETGRGVTPGRRVIA